MYGAVWLNLPFLLQVSRANKGELQFLAHSSAPDHMSLELANEKQAGVSSTWRFKKHCASEVIALQEKETSFEQEVQEMQAQLDQALSERRSLEIEVGLLREQYEQIKVQAILLLIASNHIL